MAEKATQPPQAPVIKKKNKRTPVKKIAFTIFIGALILFGSFYFVQYTRLSAKYAAIPEVKNKEIQNKVAKLIDVPKDEVPDIYELNDKDKLSSDSPSTKEFFNNAKNGDIVLAYKKANQAIVYRPSENRVIKTDVYQKLVTIKVAIIAPSDQQSGIVQQLQGKFGNVQITSKESPKISTGQSYVVDLSGANAKTAADLAAQLGLTVGSLPEGESKPEGAIFAVVISPAPPL